MNVHRGYLPGCIGRIVELHASYYSVSQGFGLPFEAKVAAELAAFCLSYRDDRDGLWLANDKGVVHGSIAIDGTYAATEGAHLRWFVASDAIRGSGLGNSLLAAALAFCDECHYRKVYLWTFDQLHAARHLYRKHGFELSRSQHGAQWGKVVNEQLFVRDRG